MIRHQHVGMDITPVPARLPKSSQVRHPFKGAKSLILLITNFITRNIYRLPAFGGAIYCRNRMPAAIESEKKQLNDACHIKY